MSGDYTRPPALDGADVAAPLVLKGWRGIAHATQVVAITGAG